ncbi:PD40 domain-containing protein [Pseudoalteromonas rubra]|uniref:PD40 domain-containing protein n=1 Tax=Pseudoalteromonas rubra TaxID=43658 RepID=UPI000F78D5FC|nr:PD40 domain-containing protein [Pseudoalteromonas rubra]
MKPIMLLMVLVSASLMSTENQAKSTLDAPTGPYLGQKKPGSVPQVFAPGLVSTIHRDYNAFFSPDMTEFYFTRRNNDTGKWTLMSYIQRNNQWHEQVIGPRVGRPFLAPDGKTMHLGKYYMERTACGWGSLQVLGPMFDRDDWGIMRLTSSGKGTYILDDYKNGDVIRISEVLNGQRQAPVALGPEVNTGKYNAHPFIAPDDSYIIWDGQREEGYGDSDLYISFRQTDGSWGEAINLGPQVNTSGREASATVTPDGKYLFFNRDTGLAEGDIYWVDAQVIESLRPEKR